MGVEILLHLFLILAVDGGEWSTSCLGGSAFRGGRTFTVHYIAGWQHP